MKKINKILVLGATGQLGAYAALHLKDIGYDIVAVGHRTTDNGFFNTKSIDYIGGFSLENPSDYIKLPTDTDAVVHMAGTMPAHADANPMPYIQSIIVGMVNLCEWLKNKTKCKRVIFNTTPSDVCAFFGSAMPVPDDSPRSFPKDGGDHAIYAIAKNAAVDILESYKYSDGISSCVFRHLTVYGYHPNPYYYLNGFKKKLPWRQIIDNAIEGKEIEVWGNPSRLKELLYIADFSYAIEMALKTGVEGIFNLSGYQPYSLEDQIDGIIEVFSNTANKSIKKYCPEKSNTPQNLLDSRKARDILGWTPKYSWVDACKEIKREMMEEPLKLLWGQSSDY